MSANLMVRDSQWDRTHGRQSDLCKCQFAQTLHAIMSSWDFITFIYSREGQKITIDYEHNTSNNGSQHSFIQFPAPRTFKIIFTVRPFNFDFQTHVFLYLFSIFFSILSVFNGSLVVTGKHKLWVTNWLNQNIQNSYFEAIYNCGAC